MTRNPIEQFAAAVAATNSASASTKRNYLAGRVPMVLKLILADPNIAAAFARDVRRMTDEERRELRGKR